MGKTYFVHESAYVDEGATVGDGTSIWHFCHVESGASVGPRCSLGQNTYVGKGAVLGSGVKVQNNVSIYAGVVVEDDVFLGPSCVFTNIKNPRSEIRRRSLYERTFVGRGTTIGANATIVCGVTIGRYAFIAAGTVVTTHVPDYALIVGVPGRQQGWMSRHGHRLTARDRDGLLICPESGYRYEIVSDREIRCLDLDTEQQLPEEATEGTVTYEACKGLNPNGGEDA
jgi:UDP-2-acetamido-3-amino-2,3-dideoxy-glucuronate N-acetyltransferase